MAKRPLTSEAAERIHDGLRIVREDVRSGVGSEPTPERFAKASTASELPHSCSVPVP
jgi:hypothetical protein